MADDAFTPEWMPRDLSEPIAQGDVFEWCKPYRSDAWTHFGVIVTADCDIAHEKYRGRLSYCPVLRLSDFVSIYWLPEELRKQHAHYVQQTTVLVSKLRRQHAPEFDLEIDSALILPWLKRRGAEGVADDLRLPPNKPRTTLMAILAVMQLIDATLECVEIGEQLRVAACARRGAVQLEKAELDEQKRAIWRDMTGRSRRLPGDLFFINQLGAGLLGGFVVCLRLVRELSQEQLATDPVRERQDAAVRAVRVSRLDAPYRYRLTQQLAGVFADIGLPAPYERACIDTFSGLGTELGIPPLERTKP